MSHTRDCANMVLERTYRLVIFDMLWLIELAGWNVCSNVLTEEATFKKWFASLVIRSCFSSRVNIFSVEFHVRKQSGDVKIKKKIPRATVHHNTANVETP